MRREQCVRFQDAMTFGSCVGERKRGVDEDDSLCLMLLFVQ